MGNFTSALLGKFTSALTIRDKAAAAGSFDVAFVAVTANALPEQIADYLAAGFRACVTKPVSRAKLEAALSDALPVIRTCG